MSGAASYNLFDHSKWINQKGPLRKVKAVNALPQGEYILLILLFQARSNNEGKVQASPPNPVPLGMFQKERG
jgi:hypothetical protein